MGDSGSYFLGYMLAATALIGTPQKASTAVSLLVPIMALGVPIFDTLFAMVRRILEKRSVFSPDRGHIHHRLLDMGLTHRRAVMIIYAVCGVFTAAAIGVSFESAWPVGVALFAGSAVLIGLVRFVGYLDYFHLRFRQRARIRSRDAELLRRAIPRLPQRFADAGSEAELIEELWRFAAETDLRVVELVTEDERRVHRWPSGEDGGSGAERDLVRASYPLGRDGVARSEVRFAWRCDFGDVPPQSEILLQIAADLLAQNLGRLRSALTPSGEPIKRHVSEPPDLLDIPARPSRV
jgi:UDP-GlcNAc:undecaprenyl-phosphate GlcNAc-1-phosphate transferase